MISIGYQSRKLLTSSLADNRVSRRHLSRVTKHKSRYHAPALRGCNLESASRDSDCGESSVPAERRLLRAIGCQKHLDTATFHFAP